MTMQARLQKVTQGLSPLQRAVLVLQAQREGREPDPELGRISDAQQSRIFNRYLALACVINRELGAFAHTVSGLSTTLDCCAHQVRLLEQAAAQLEEEHGLKRARRPRDWRKTKEVSIPEFLRSLAQELRHDLLDGVELHWKELRALEIVWGELAAEFDGEDPVHPDLRKQAATTAATLRALAIEMGGRRRLGEPDDAVLANVCHLVDESFEMLEPLL